MILNDREIRRLAEEEGMIDPFLPGLEREGRLSFGLSSFGYDARLADEFLVPVTGPWTALDPKRVPEDAFVRVRLSEPTVPAGGFLLGRTVETFRMPDDVLALCTGKSTYARCGVMVLVTPLEPGWVGTVTLEIVNHSPWPVRLYPGEGICQFVFLRGERPCTTYAERNGKYMHQTGVTPARV